MAYNKAMQTMLLWYTLKLAWTYFSVANKQALLMCLIFIKLGCCKLAIVINKIRIFF